MRSLYEGYMWCYLSLNLSFKSRLKLDLSSIPHNLVAVAVCSASLLLLSVLQERSATSHLIPTQTAALWNSRLGSDLTLGSCCSSCSWEVRSVYTWHCCSVRSQFRHPRGGLCAGEHTNTQKRIYFRHQYSDDNYCIFLHRFSVRQGERPPAFCIFLTSSDGGTLWAPL